VNDIWRLKTDGEIYQPCYMRFGFYIGKAETADSSCNNLQGAVFIANAGIYLGKIIDQYDSAGIFNEYGAIALNIHRLHR